MTLPLEYPCKILHFLPRRSQEILLLLSVTQVFRRQERRKASGTYVKILFISTATRAGFPSFAQPAGRGTQIAWGFSLSLSEILLVRSGAIYSQSLLHLETVGDFPTY
jgi:hypothetical protein